MKGTKQQQERLYSLAAERRSLHVAAEQLKQEISATTEEFEQLLLKCLDDTSQKEVFDLDVPCYVGFNKGKKSVPLNAFVVELAKRKVSANVIAAAREAATKESDKLTPVIMPVRRKKSNADGEGEDDYDHQV